MNISYEEAPTNNPREYLPFCGILALGEHYCYADEGIKDLIMTQFKTAMNVDTGTVLLSESHFVTSLR